MSKTFLMATGYNPEDIRDAICHTKVDGLVLPTRTSSNGTNQDSLLHFIIEKNPHLSLLLPILDLKEGRLQLHQMEALSNSLTPLLKAGTNIILSDPWYSYDKKEKLPRDIPDSALIELGSFFAGVELAKVNHSKRAILCEPIQGFIDLHGNPGAVARELNQGANVYLPDTIFSSSPLAEIVTQEGSEKVHILMRNPSFIKRV